MKLKKVDTLMMWHPLLWNNGSAGQGRKLETQFGEERIHNLNSCIIKKQKNNKRKKENESKNSDSNIKNKNDKKQKNSLFQKNINVKS